MYFNLFQFKLKSGCAFGFKFTEIQQISARIAYSKDKCWDKNYVKIILNKNCKFE